MIKPGRAGAGCTQFPFFMRRHKRCQPPQTNWLSLKSALKGPNYHYFYAAGNVHCLALVSRAMLAHICSKQINLSRTREQFFGFDRIPILQSASALCFCSAIVPCGDSMAQLETED